MLIKLIRWLRRPFDYVCHIETGGFAGKIGDLCAWFASGTECRCCIGMRIPFAFFLGLLIGWVIGA